MTDAVAQPDDPFAPPDSRVARFARRLGCTEGQLYSLAIGVLAVWTLSSNSLPGVLWGRVSGSTTPLFTIAGSPAQSVTSVGPLTGPPPAAPPALAPLPLPSPMPMPMPMPMPPFPGSPPAAAVPPPGEPVDGTAQPTPTTEPARITGGGYASADAGTPLATSGVPEGSVAVSRRLGDTDKITFLHVVGNGGVLKLAVDPNGTNVLAEQATIKLCPVVDGTWQVGRGDVTPAAAPTYDCTSAVQGVRASTGDAWTFDLGSVDVQRGDGVAVLPGDDPSPASSFQLVYRLPTTADPRQERAHD